MSSPQNLKRSREETAEPDSQEIPEKRPTVESNLLKPSQFKETTATKMNGLFKPSILQATDDYQKTMEKIAEKQKTEKKEPIVLKDPAKSYHPEGNKTSLPTITTTTPSSGGASLGVFGKNISQKVSETKESESKPEETEKSETETDKKDENEKTENTETETKSSPEKAGEKRKNPFAKALENKSTSGFGGFGKSENSGFGGGGFGKSENGTAAGFKRLAGATSSSWGNSSSSSQEEVKEKKSKQEVKTGEEDEKNVLEVTTAKLFKFDRSTQQYSERGRGILRMNDKGEGSDFSSRLVFRTAGTQRVALNTQIWGGMSVEQCTKKSIRISAQDTSTDDDNEVGVFLIQCGVEQSKQLYQALSYRISQIKQKEEK